MDPIMPAMSKEVFDEAMHISVEQVIRGVRVGWRPDCAVQSNAKWVTDERGRQRLVFERVVTITLRNTDDGDLNNFERCINTPSASLTKAESLALSVLFDNKPAWALADYLQEEGLVPVPRETVAELVYRLMGYAHSRRMNAANGKWRGTAMDNQTWGVVEGLLGELWTKLNSGEDIDQWK